MAKVRPKKKSQKKIDPLTVSLRLLARADRESLRAVRSLSRAIMAPVLEPKIVDCGFKLDKKKYRARVTVDQCEQILKAVGEKDGDVLAVVTLLLSTLTAEIAASLNQFGTTLGVREKTRPKSGPPVMAGTQPVLLGCCIYAGGMTPNLTKSQCQQYNPTQWNSGDPDCTAAPLS